MLMLYYTPRPRSMPLAARILFAALMGASLVACGNDDPAPSTPVAHNPAPAPGAADPSRACSAKSASMRCAP
ncbi:hypothetical protein F2P44_20270 [Massilia sp. CCM 8695]|uniref:Lipoprotein n=1 Tax=Massilia frigida TaxID=2609281 RepID=A0ABX0N8V5_9BURK|nr:MULTISPECIES: hypothetical protein [Massilia]MDM5179279.1 hypothetical protein [Massilia sp. DJPM01]NHZ81594.1 hypothetical protein [Massilia frigida]